MSAAVAETLRTLLGPDAVEQAGQLPRAVPDSTAGVAAVCRAAHAAGWRVRVEGAGHTLPADAPADLVLTTAGLDRVSAIHPADLVATAGAGVPLDRLGRQLAAHGAWVALDPPGRPERTLGSVVATASAGPLRHRAGPVRDQILGCTAVTGDGRIVAVGAPVTKQVAGYDLTKLQAGGFGAFGVLTEFHLRLRARPGADLTLLASGERDPLARAARELEAAGMDAVACELVSPAVAAEPAWVLAVRLHGPAPAVQAEAGRVQAVAPDLRWRPLPLDAGPAWWQGVARAMGGGPVSLRLGVLPDGLDPALDLLEERLDLGRVTAGAARGGVRWCGQVDATILAALRQQFASREIPLTLERAPWELRQAVGHFGAYREGVGPLVQGLRQRFDPGGILQVALEGGAGD